MADYIQEHVVQQRAIDRKKYRIVAHKAGWWFARVQRKRWWGEWESIAGTAELGSDREDAVEGAVLNWESITWKKWPSE